MAKISARGAHEVERHKLINGTEYLLRSDNVILRKWIPGDGWTVVRNTKTPYRVLWDAIKRMR